MLEVLVSGPISLWKVPYCWLLSFEMCAPDSSPLLLRFSHWWYPPSLSVLYTVLGWHFGSRRAWLSRRHRFMGKGPGKSQTHLYCSPLGLWEREQGPEGSALDLLQLQAFSHSLLLMLPNILIFQSLSFLPRPLFMHLFYALVSFSHSF